MSNQFPPTPDGYEKPDQGFSQPPQQPVYNQQQYQAPQNSYPGPPAPANEQTNTMAIVGMILAIILPLIGAIVSGITWKKAYRLGENTTLPKIGTIVGSILTVLGAIFAVFSVLTLLAAGSSLSKYSQSQQFPDESAYVAYVKTAATVSGMDWDDATTPELALSAGESVCDELDYGTSYDEVYEMMTTDLANPKAAPLYAAVTEGAVQYLCPEYAQ